MADEAGDDDVVMKWEGERERGEIEIDSKNIKGGVWVGVGVVRSGAL